VTDLWLAYMRTMVVALPIALAVDLILMPVLVLLWWKKRTR
jgi:hypothetical protein